MRRLRRGHRGWLAGAWCLAVGALAATGQGAGADDAALIIANENYAELPDVPGRVDVSGLAARLRGAGYDVIVRTDADLEEMIDVAARFSNQADEADRLMVVLTGRFLNTGRQNYLLPVDRRDTMAATTLPTRALSVSALLDLLAGKARGAGVMVLGADDGESEARQPFVTRGLGRINAPGRATVIFGEPPEAVAFARDVLARGRAYGPRDVERARLESRGLDERRGEARPPRRPDRGGADRAERDYWRTIRTFDNERAYVNYLDRYPRGAFVEEATRRLAALRDPSRLARAGEDDLSLGREDRRRLQAALQVLGFDPGGIDGVFGPGTRGAIGRWQQANGQQATGYLTGPQLAALSEAAALRGVQLEREAAQADRDYWARTGRGGGEEGVRAYLDRYPEGQFAGEARSALDRIRAQRRETAAQSDARAFEEARGLDRVRAYRRYIRENPNGAYVERARSRIRELRGVRRDALDAAALEGESRLGLDPVTRGLIEGRLRAFGFDPGAVDGRFDEAARDAIERYQESRGLEASGYLDEDAVARLLADSLR